MIPFGPLDEAIEIHYQEDERDRRASAELSGRAAPLVRRYVDWHAYIGRNTVSVEGESWLRRIGRRAWRATIRTPPDAGGVVVGTVNRRLGPLRSTYDHDDAHNARLARWEQQFPDLARRFPRLGNATLDGEDGIILVHGTRSCGMPAVVDLADALTVPAHRFEHDTHIAIHENAAELARLIADKVTCTRLYILAHSRGGLVAKLAASRIGRARTPDSWQVWTLGTPHHGTPLVGRGLAVFGARAAPLAKALRLAKIGRAGTIDIPADEHGVPLEDPLSAILEIVLRDATLPPGIEVMAPVSPLREQLEWVNGVVTHRAIGGACTVDDVSGGRTIALAGFARGTFAGEPNDLVVALSSSIGCDGGLPLSQPCTHSGYFTDPQVRELLQAHGLTR